MTLPNGSPLVGERRSKSKESRLNQLEVRELTRLETHSAAAVLGNGMRDNPLHARAFGENPDRREAALTRIFGALLRQYLAKGAVLGAFSSGTLIGVCGMVQPGRCQPTTADKLRLLPAFLAGSGLGGTIRALRWAEAWSGHDPKEAHWHLGPLAVERHRQGKGVGSTLLREFCARMDASHSMAYLETDKRENLPLYERFGFQVTVEQQVIGVPNWFMVRSVGR